MVIARNGVPVAKIVKYTANKIASPGAWKGKVAYVTDWDSTQTNSEIEHLFTDEHHAPITYLIDC